MSDHPPYAVAITGVGIVSTLGVGAKAVTVGLREGRSGIRLDPERKRLGFRSALTGVIDGFTPPPLSRRHRKTLTEFGLQAYAAALEAIATAGWDDGEVRNDRTALIVGNDSSALANIEPIDIVRREGSTLPVGAGLVFQALNSTVTMNLNVLLGTQGAAWTVSGACASGGHAIGQAADLIALGRQDRAIAGGVQEINWQSVASFDATNAFSTREDDPEGAVRPFDRERDGLVPSGGAAVVALEREDLARRRGATILGRIASYAFSSDGHNLAVPSGDGLRRAMAQCLELARVAPDAVDHVSAHATSTPVGDAAEATAIHQVFGSARPWVSSVKSMTGHEMWMAGAAQVVYAVLESVGGFITANRNFREQEPEAPPLRIAVETIDERPRTILCNSAGFGGTNSCILVCCD